MKNRDDVRDFQKIFDALSDLESRLFYLKDVAFEVGLDRLDVEVVRGYVDSALRKWHELTGVDNTTGEVEGQE